MQSLGLPEEDIKLFCSDNLFPIIKEWNEKTTSNIFVNDIFRISRRN
jgi:hypothetical protein